MSRCVAEVREKEELTVRRAIWVGVVVRAVVVGVMVGVLVGRAGTVVARAVMVALGICTD